MKIFNGLCSINQFETFKPNITEPTLPIITKPPIPARNIPEILNPVGHPLCKCQIQKFNCLNSVKQKSDKSYQLSQNDFFLPLKLIS